MRSYIHSDKRFGAIFDPCHGTIDYRLTFPHVKLALDGHRKGPGHGIPLNFLAYTEVATAHHGKPSTLVSAEPNIIDDELFLRVQLWAVFEKDVPPETENFYGPGACMHGGRLPTHEMIDCHATYNGESSECEKCKSTYRYKRCDTEFGSDSLVLEGRRLAVVITKWLNLGKGLSHHDADWKKFRGLVFYSPPSDDPSKRPGTNDVFEAHTGVTKDIITREKAALLSGEAFKEKLHKKHGADVWQSRV